MENLKEKIFTISSNEEFNVCALAVFQFQYDTNYIYKQFVDGLKIKADEVVSISQIPFLPISFFKNCRVACSADKEEIQFTSSGTTGITTSTHFVLDKSIYETSYCKAFELFYGKVQEYCIIALLPSYSERRDSSLIYMVDDLIAKSQHVLSGYYLNADEELRDKLLELKNQNKKTLLIGVTYSLLNFADKFKLELSNCIIMETGGMKGKRKEMVREEVHQILQNAFGVIEIHSEYGMTELLSQAYSNGNGIFKCPPWMKVEAREIDDPLSPALTQKTGGLNVIDLANLNSCSFISTQDLCKVYPDNSFE